MGKFIVACLDGRGFTKLTKEFVDKPFSSLFNMYMVETTKHLMSCGFNIVYAYTESDEISLLFNENENSFNRKLRKLNSVLSGEASAKFSTLSGKIACFDCRISELPDTESVIDYFRWRQGDSRRNALNSACHWSLLAAGEHTPRSATKFLNGANEAFKRDFLWDSSPLSWGAMPSWQRNGVDFHWEKVQRPGVNPMTGENVICSRKVIKEQRELPSREQYGDYLKELLFEGNKMMTFEFTEEQAQSVCVAINCMTSRDKKVNKLIQETFDILYEQLAPWVDTDKFDEVENTLFHEV